MSRRRPWLRGLFPSEGVTDAEVKTLLALLDRDGDGYVTLREIIECVRALRSATSDGADEVGFFGRELNSFDT